MPPAAPKRLYLLDNLRGLAALAVVVWHYKQFFFVAPGEYGADFSKTSLPFYSLFRLFYEHGYLAVYLFFALSGFVFYFNYYERIHCRSVSAFQFLIRRFSRLYPLHFVTLVFVAVIQFDAMETWGSFIIYPMNDLKHFLLNLFFASNWGLHDGLSFNAPVWSVSIEVLLYAAFFITALVAPRTVVVPVLLALIGALMAANGIWHIGWGFCCFFAGGLAFEVYARPGQRGQRARPWTPLLAALALLLGAGTLFAIAFAQSWPTLLVAAALFGGCFPLLILVLAAAQTLAPQAGQAVKLIGDISYATYLLHFPIQLSWIWVAKSAGFSPDYTNPIWFVLYLACVILLSVPTYYFFERPAQTFLRRRLIDLRATGAA